MTWQGAQRFIQRSQDNGTQVKQVRAEQTITKEGNTQEQEGRTNVEN